MHIVVSRWEALPGREEEFEMQSRVVRSKLRALDGIQMFHSFRDEEGKTVAVIGYRDEAVYRRLIEDPAGPFARTIAEHGLENSGRWMWSLRGEEMD